LTDPAPVYPRVLDELAPAASHRTLRDQLDQAYHGRLKHRLRRLRTADVVITGLAFAQNLRRGGHPKQFPWKNVCE
jgi:IS6 family transposase